MINSNPSLSSAWKSGYAQAKEEADMDHRFCPHCNPCDHRGNKKCRAVDAKKGAKMSDLQEMAATPTKISSGLSQESAVGTAASPREESGPLADIRAERQRQQEVEGWTTEYDDDHRDCKLALAAACYAAHAGGQYRNALPEIWPWKREWWKPKNARRDLVRAGALIVAEIERLDRGRGSGAMSEDTKVLIERLRELATYKYQYHTVHVPANLYHAASTIERLECELAAARERATKKEKE